MSYRITPIADEDIPGLRAALDAVARERRYLAFLEAPPLAQTRAFVRDMRAVRFPQFVARVGEQVVGWCDISPLDRPVYRHCGILGIGIIAGYRRQGIGTALLRAALKQAKEIGLKRVELTVRAPNRVAIALYQKLGFMQEGVKRNAIYIDGVYEDLVIMALLY
ncbi:MAG: GNAT family N-acetyltransferase [Sulfurifustis sp.]